MFICIWVSVYSLVHVNQCQLTEAQGILTETQDSLRLESLARQHAEEALIRSKSSTWQDHSFHYLPVPLTPLMSSYVFTHLHTRTYSQSPSDLEQLLDTQTKKLRITIHELERCHHIALPLLLPDPLSQPSLPPTLPPHFDATCLPPTAPP